MKLADLSAWAMLLFMAVGISKAFLFNFISNGSINAQALLVVTSLEGFAWILLGYIIVQICKEKS